MKQLLRTVAVLILLLSPTFANTGPIARKGNEVNLYDCGSYSLTLQFPNLNEINNDSIIFPALRCLTIKNDQIERVNDGAFAKMPHLQYLNLQGNSISADNLFSFGTLSSVRKLILSDQCSHYWYRCRHPVARVLGIYPQLLHLDLKNTGISNIESAGQNPFPELTHLDLSMNKIENFNFTPPWAEKLTDLNFTDNKISNISLRLSDLTTLVLNNNNITTIGDNGLDLVNLPNLENLSVAHNQIDFICEAAFSHTNKLRHLDLSMNLLSTPDPLQFKFPESLQVLVLDQNYFEEVPRMESFKMTNLSMNCNCIKLLTNTSLNTLSELKTLSLTGNKMQDVETNAFQNQNMLENLYLNNNELKDLPNGWCRTMKNLGRLDLSWNKFSKLELMINCNVPSLRHINVKHNPVTFINAATLQTLPKDVSVYLNSEWNKSTPKCQARECITRNETTTTDRCIKTTTSTNTTTTTPTPPTTNTTSTMSNTIPDTKVSSQT